MTGISLEPDGVCPWCGLRAQVPTLLAHMCEHTAPRAELSNMVECPRCANLDGTVMESCYCREETAAGG